MKIKDYRAGLLERLKDAEYAVGYLREVIANESSDAFLIALRDVIDAREENISALSKEAGITRQALYNALSESGNPRFSTITQVLKTLGLQLTIRQTEAA
jgi:probable addiction module antidote protein